MILIVDDKPENIYSLRKLLELHGFPVDAADSGEEALKKILSHQYSLIILDVQMPGMDGFEVAETISGYSKSKNIPIIFLSAVNTDKRFVTKGYASGGIDYITKPVDPDILMHKVRTLHNLTQQNRELNIAHDHLQQQIHESRQAAEELNDKVEELQLILESIPQIAFTTKPDGEVEFVNEGWYLYSGSVAAFPKFHSVDQPLYDHMQENFKKGAPFMKEVRIENIITKEFRYHLLKLIPVKQGKTLLKWVGTFTDIHEQKTANKKLEQIVKERTRELSHKNEELETRNHELQQFAYVASHDLKEPLRKIQLFSSMLEDALPGDLLSGVNKYLDRIKESSQRMSTLITDLLEYTRLSIDALFEKTDIRKIITDLVDDLDYLIIAKDATVTVSEIPRIEVIPGQMRQVFQNLITNALKFAKAEEAPVIKIAASRVGSLDALAPTEDGGDYCRITVSDNGIGFNEDYIDKIFTIFQRLNDRKLYEGTGIGLAIAKKIIEKHGGIITAKSNEGEGATFIMVLPLSHQPVSAETHTYQDILN